MSRGASVRGISAFISASATTAILSATDGPARYENLERTVFRREKSDEDLNGGDDSDNEKYEILDKVKSTEKNGNTQNGETASASRETSKLQASVSSQASDTSETSSQQSIPFGIVTPSMFRSFLTVTPTTQEADAAIESMISRPDLLRSMLPAAYGKTNPVVMDGIFSMVRDAVTDPALVRSTVMNMNTVENGKVDSFEQMDSEESSEQSILLFCEDFLSDAGQQWEKLKEKYPCAICQDVLAAPNILNCSHSFCGSCLNELKEKASCADAEIGHCCPNCKEEITHNIFERTLDGEILRLVDAIPKCQGKENWKERRQAYFKAFIRDNRSAFAEDGVKEEEDDDDDSFWNDLKKCVVPVLAFAVLLLIALCRK